MKKAMLLILAVTMLLSFSVSAMAFPITPGGCDEASERGWQDPNYNWKCLQMAIFQGYDGDGYPEGW